MIIRPESGKVSRWAVLGLVIFFAILAGNECNTWFGDIHLMTISTTMVSAGMAGAIIIVALLGGFGFYFTQVNKRSVDFLVDVQSEMAKVSWSSRKDLVNNTIVVIILCVIFGVYVYAVDYGLSMLMDFIHEI